MISSDAGHAGAQNPTFGIDPQARLDYGYQAVAKLTPMAKAVIQTAYGKGPDRSYFGGCSNGGRHAMVAAARYADQYDGFLVGDPGLRLPLAAIANIAGDQAYAEPSPPTPADPSTGFTAAERQLVANAVLAKCDALDGATDGLVQDTEGLPGRVRPRPRRADLHRRARRHLPLARRRRPASAKLLRRRDDEHRHQASTRASRTTPGWRRRLGADLEVRRAADARLPARSAFIWQVPPANPATFNGPTFAADRQRRHAAVPQIQATNATYTENSLSFMTPPQPDRPVDR